jgi:exopolyphosphatase/guanosine-5'-triphosphate,3'-diphosphate pyrophosphatase
LKIETLEPCSFALREGVIIDYLREIEAESLPPVPDVEDKKLRGRFRHRQAFRLRRIARPAGRRFGGKNFRRARAVYNLQRHWRTLLSAAALLHDVGYHISHESHHKHSLYLIKHSEITGFSENEKKSSPTSRVIIAARCPERYKRIYQRKSRRSFELKRQSKFGKTASNFTKAVFFEVMSRIFRQNVKIFS